MNLDLSQAHTQPQKNRGFKLNVLKLINIYSFNCQCSYRISSIIRQSLTKAWCKPTVYEINEAHSIPTVDHSIQNKFQLPTRLEAVEVVEKTLIEAILDHSNRMFIVFVVVLRLY